MIGAKNTSEPVRSVGYVSLVYGYVVAMTGIPRKYIGWYFGTHPSNFPINADGFAREYELPRLDAKYGIFVTIYKHGKLRGCVGTFDRSDNIGYLIAHQTHMAGFEDSRFDPLDSLDSLDGLEFSVNFLGEQVEIEPTHEDVQNKLHLGLHGIVMGFANGANATFLASVLTKHFNIKVMGMAEWERVCNALRDKCGGVGAITWVRIYRCDEFGEQHDDANVMGVLGTRILGTMGDHTGGHSDHGETWERRYLKQKTKYIDLRDLHKKRSM
jgi:hypothetical protein